MDSDKFHAVTSITKIEKIIEWVDFLGLEAVDEPTYFSPGLPRDQVVRQLESHEVPSLPELIELYCWRDGCSYIYGVGLEALSLRRALDHFDDWHPDYGRPRTWFPVATFNGDVWIYLDLDTMALHLLDIEGGHTRTLAAHYDVYLDALLEGLAADGAHWDEDEGGIVLGPGVWPAIAQRLSVDP